MKVASLDPLMNLLQCFFAVRMMEQPCGFHKAKEYCGVSAHLGLPIGFGCCLNVGHPCRKYLMTIEQVRSAAWELR